MLKKFLELSSSKKLGAVALILGLFAIVAGSPYDTNVAKVDTKELSLLVEKELDHINVETLADWIIKGKADYRLIDIRSEKEFGEYNIPSSENYPLSQLNNSGLMRNEKIILYSEGGIHSAQAWFLLKAKDFKNVYMLRGGLDEWKDRILFPAISTADDSLHPEATAKLREVSKFFGGVPQSESGDGNTIKTKIPLPTLSAPVQQPVTSTKKKKKEGC
ncbi:MAG: rhodanese-like domain-containing protein [Ignavibacteriales bacterium]|nr:MAG: rhodanese-like domain-containing protein [Ignavibacteriales bacterium]